jgi:hypothetical protein
MEGGCGGLAGHGMWRGLGRALAPAARESGRGRQRLGDALGRGVEGEGVAGMWAGSGVGPSCSGRGNGDRWGTGR